jgi:hypothetical protein
MNLVGPGAYLIGNDQKMIPYENGAFPQHARFGSQQMTDASGNFNTTPIVSVTGATCQ